MDPITAVSTAGVAIQLLQVAIDVSSALHQYMAAVRGAESSYSELIDQITLISRAAQAAQSVLENSPTPSLRTPEQQALHTEWFRSDGSPARCQRDLEGLLTWLCDETGGNQFTRGVKRLMWPVKEKRIRAAIQTFEGHMPYFRDMLSIDTASWVRGIHSEMRNEHEHARNNETADAGRKLLEWLDGLDCTVKYETTRELRQRTTGEWLINEKLYMDWRSSSIRFLWLAGKPGAGKSVLASTIIDNLSSGLAKNETLAYFYCDFRTPKSTRTVVILRSLTVQFLRDSKIDWMSSKPFSGLVIRKERDADPPMDIRTLSDLLKSASGLHQRPMIVIDALDECNDLSKLLPVLVALHGEGKCRVFVTARPLHSINRAFVRLPSISLDDRVEAVCNDMSCHVNKELESRDWLKTLSHDVQEEIRVALMEKANGMFRWVQLQLDRLNECLSLRDLREALETIPATLYETYDRMLCAIDKKEFGGRVARRALMWLVTALDSLTLSQLAEALVINVDKPALDSTFAPMHDTRILEICGSLVTYHEETGIITLSHYSVKEYLTSNGIADKTYFVDHPRASFELASVSIHSIMLFIDQHGDKGRDSEDLLSEDHLSKRPLFHYATISGFRHLENCIPEYNDPLLGNLVTLQDHVSNHRRSYAILLCDRIYTHWWMTKISQLALYIIIRFGHASMLQHYLDHCSVQVAKGANPLVYAALYTDVPRFQILLDSGLDVDVEAIVTPTYGWCHNSLNVLPLIAATFNQDQELLKLLVRRTMTPPDAIHSVLQVPTLDDVPRTRDIPQPSAIDFLLQHGADAMLSVAEGNTCLHLLLIRWSGDEHTNLLEIARLLVEAGGDPVVLNDEGLSPFHLALRKGALQFVQWLIAKGFQPPPDAIVHAAHSSHKDLPTLLHVLFECGITADIEDDDGNNALHILARSYGDSVNTCQLLLDKGCGVDHQNHQGETPLHLAAKWHNLPLTEFLLDQGAQLPDDIINHVCWVDWIGGPSTLMALLICLVKNHGASCQAWTACGDNALHILLQGQGPLATQGSEPIQEFLFLMENGCDFLATGSLGITVLGIAIENGHTSIAGSLISPVARPHAHRESDPGDAEGNTILHRLCYRLRFRRLYNDDLEGTWVNKVELLQEAGFDLAKNVNKPNHDGFTPLYIVLEGGGHHPVVVSHLLRLGAKFSDVNPLFLDNVEWASNLPWYHDATEAYERALAKPTITFSDVVRVHHLLANNCGSKLPAHIVRLVMDMAEYWACTKVVRENVQCTGLDGSHGPIALPIVSHGTWCWMPRRVMFSCKESASNLSEYFLSDSFKLSIQHQKVVYALPLGLNVKRPHELPRTEFCAWDRYTPAKQWNGSQQLAVKDLTSGDTLSLRIESCEGHPSESDALELEFFQIDMYFTMSPTDDDPPSSIGEEA
ncbi:hypothetical protein BU15DRAFT_82805 [Melanogaster broomeanus]|nr:hypothetical protein BU15DRAFT_82805 [Melanogaster broomeanus]